MNSLMFKLVLEKAEEPEIKLPTSIRTSIKQESSRKTSTCALLTMPKTLCGSHKLWKILQKMEILDHLPCLLRNLYAAEEATVRTRHGSNLGKEYIKAVYCHPAYLTYMQSTSYETPGWMNHRLELRLPGEISTTSEISTICRWYDSNGRKYGGTKEPLDESERGK